MPQKTQVSENTGLQWNITKVFRCPTSADGESADVPSETNRGPQTDRGRGSNQRKQPEEATRGSNRSKQPQEDGLWKKEHPSSAVLQLHVLSESYQNQVKQLTNNLQ